jgi:glycosyltransferase involved in cell wall biosynthesis
LALTEHDVYFLRFEQGPFVSETRPIPKNISQVQWDGNHPFKNLFSFLSARRRLMEVLFEVKPDLVHAGPVQKAAFLTASVGFSPLITMSWGSDLLLDAQQGLGRWLAKFTLNRTSVFLGDCQAVAKMAAELGMPVDRTIIFPWGIDLDHYKPDGPSVIRQRLGWQDKIILLSTRSMEAIYGVEIVSEAFIELAKSEENVCLLLLGDGSLRQRIEAGLKRAELDDRTHFAGQVSFEELPDYYRAADLYVSASYVDGSSISLLEAMACGLPAFVSDIPGNLEWVSPGKNGWVFSTGSSRSLVEGISRALQDKNHLQAYGMAARQIAEERADWKHNSEKLLQAYQIAYQSYGGNHHA